ncbi:LamG domain-containing protein, partial [bacterium]|nr:LamG domain-containing protein [bacterium]
WKFDEGEGTQAGDSSGNGNDGTVHDASWTTGELDGALEFDGNGDYVDLDYPEPVIIPDEYPKSICAWINVDSPWKDYERIFMWYDETNTVVVALHEWVGGMGKLGGTLNGNTGVVPVTTNAICSIGEWHHVCFTFNGLTTSIYFDGEKQSVVSLGTWGVNDTGVFIGASKGGEANRYFDGKIDDVRVYNYALGIGEIWDLTFYDTSKLFSIKNSSGVRVAWFDNLGNLFLKGKQKEWQEPSGQADEFIIEKNNGAVVYINDSGDLFLEIGSVIEGQTPSATGADEFRVQDSEGNDVAIIRASNGSVYLKGKLYQDPEQ